MAMDMMKKKLGKLKMPEKKGMDLSSLKDEESPELEKKEEDMGLDLDNDDEAGEGMEHSEEVKEGGDKLAGASDEELMAELKKRGLMKDMMMKGEHESESNDQDMYS